MASRVPLSKAAEIRSTLTNFIDDQSSMSEFEGKLCEREINKLQDASERDELKALLLGACGKTAEAITQFEKAIRIHAKYSTICNYCIFLKKAGCFKKAKAAYVTYYNWFDDAQMLQSACAFLSLSAEMDAIKVCSLKLAGLLGQDTDEAKTVMYRYANLIEVVQEAKDVCGVNESDIDSITDIALGIADQYKIPDHIGCFDVIDSTFTFVVSVDKEYSQKLADLNIDASFALAEREELLSKDITILFQEVRTAQ